ncbi:MAG: addiction module protein [Chloroflexi bacterium]|nr:addiction module protein [Chloroflexota bacterium]
MNAGEVAVETLKLNERERAALVEQLLRSLESPSDAKIERLWVSEAERRNEEIPSGTVKARSANDVLRDLRSWRS